ncbi:regulator of Ty1 Transposition [Coemansia aciculifera]|uniref:Regulator of Ty1 Transposition n=1 Tax=Coemansia aciculifera TaxID=417176 RepID=A0A9W8IK15_9FUNG|nr:regulator of Ty1 Transposition [Coemansia aciculifera]
MTGDSELVQSSHLPSTTAAVQLSEAERKHFARHSDPAFNGVVFWINPIFGRLESARIAQMLEHGGGRPATIRHHSKAARDGKMSEDAVQKLNGVLVRALPQMVSHISRFYLPSAGLHGNGDVQRVTHVISPDTHFGEYQACVKAGVHVVTSLWVERSLMSGLQYVERYFSARTQDIFSGMVVTATHMPTADKEVLLASVMALGGQWREKMRADVTHLILMKDEGPKYEIAKKNPQLNIRPLLPHWFKETLNLLHPVPLEPYLFPNPPMLEGKLTHNDDGNANNAALAVPSSDTHNGSAYELPKPSVAFMRGYTVAIDTQLVYSLSEGAFARLGQRLGEAGATLAKLQPGTGGRGRNSSNANLAESVVADWDSVDILVCQHRSGYDYSKASRLGKIVGTFVWLYQAFLSEKLSAPTQRLLHYPVPAVMVAGMERMVITISHYRGASREYLIRLITALGARYTAKMSKDNTHLITASPEGRKYAAALQWNVNVVNHFWIEQCYQRWKLLTVSHPNFTYFPDLPVLNSMVGDTDIIIDKLKAWVEAPQGSSIAESSDMDVLGDSDLEPMRREVAVNGKREMEMNIDDESGEEMKSVVDSSDELSNGAQASEEALLVLGQRRHTSRAAAMAASKNLEVIMQAANTFEEDMRKERLYKYRKSHNARRSLALGEREDEEQQAKAVSNKRARIESNSSSRPVRIMFTGVRATEQETQQIVSMGGEVVEDAKLATHLVCNEIKRTLKMLMAVSGGRVNIVSMVWVRQSLAQRRWISMDPVDGDPLADKCHVVDAVSEKKWDFSLEESIQRARKRRLLEGVTVFLTPQSEPKLKVLQPLIEIAGGRAVDNLDDAELRSLINASVRVQKRPSFAGEIPPLLVVSCSEDSHMWAMFRPSADKRMPIYATEVLLTGVLRQEIQRSDDSLGNEA